MPFFRSIITKKGNKVRLVINASGTRSATQPKSNKKRGVILKESLL